MPMIDSDIIKEGLLPVQKADRIYTDACATRQAAKDSKADMAPIFEAEKVAYDEYINACMVFYSYARGTVNHAEGRSFDQDE